MPHDRTPARRDGTLAPRRWPVRPSGGSTLRWALVAALLTLALGLLYLRQPSSSCPDPAIAERSAGGSSVPTPAGTTSGSGGPATRAGASGGPAARAGASGVPPGTGGGSLPVPAGAVGVPIRLAEPAALTVARPGARVDLLAVPGGDRVGGAPRSTVLAARVLVLDVLEAGPDEGAASAIYLALSPDQAHRAVGMPEPTRFAIIVRP
ncbi:flagellar biosynthesis protein FlgA [Plantactinospora sp. S1510]|uniref:Flagellar biosynthesis protein FlgA n=1 Tax=Plantactinospora alkalitolerans TaxID=2789879 RepID=A0ABS0GYK0_9ACTN|nr:flagellar biosynthesis protein FlgA [Plantactinospora alkalitolerans]MBF9131293.1 flagellar biosynthesis protein FlgA [Plantactinospora alkalitolerans]